MMEKNDAPRINYEKAWAVLRRTLQEALAANLKYFGKGRCFPDGSLGEAIRLGLENRGADEVALSWIRDLPWQVEAWIRDLNRMEEEARNEPNR